RLFMLGREDAEDESGGGHLAGDPDPLAAQIRERERLARDHDRTVAVPHRDAGPHHEVPIGDVRVRVRGDRGDLEFPFERALVERLDVLQLVLDAPAAESIRFLYLDAHVSGVEAVEHERVIRIRTVSEGERAFVHYGHRHDFSLADLAQALVGRRENRFFIFARTALESRGMSTRSRSESTGLPPISTGLLPDLDRIPPDFYRDFHRSRFHAAFDRVASRSRASLF